ncbi:hypothetical protein VTO42DRAFT_5528 [Malbranchea cinnamomea]
MRVSLLLYLAVLTAADLSALPPLPASYHAPGLPVGPPLDPPAYMVDNQGNTHGAAPDKGSLNRPVVTPADVAELLSNKSGSHAPGVEKRQEGSFWMESITHGQMPFAPEGYQFFRNVKDFGAVGDGITDDTQAINRAASWFSETDDTERCGQDCGQTTRFGALVYFPPGEYLISSPIIQYYFTQFVGDANNKPTIKGSQNFTGIALIDCDPYIPGGNGANWYINQNQFFRQIRNFRFDLTEMNRINYDNDQEYVPTGIHWQVSQAASLQYLDFIMPVSDESGATTAVGIFMENGSGGFLSDLTFFGGNIGFRAGSQQYTARNLQFTSCLTAISMIWDWGFTWKNIKVLSCWVAIDCTNVGGIGNQGTGSITVMDSHFDGVPYAITLRNGGPHPNIVLDNLLVENSASVVLISGGETIFEGSSSPIYFDSWAMGRRYTSLDGEGEFVTGHMNPAPIRPPALLDEAGNIYTRSKPQYERLSPSNFVIATEHGVSNDGTGDQSDAINDLLRSNVGTPIFFPAGIYMVEKTVFVPVGSVIVGELWSQIMGTGSFFEDEGDPKVMVRVGNPGDSGVIEISDMLFTVKGPTRGAILMEWNVHEDGQGSAAMWDSHFRVGGAYGSDLTMEECPKLTGEVNRDCMAAALLFHVTERASGYFENVWIWTADHDMDVPVPQMENTTTFAQIDIYTARGTLIESQGPCWFYGTGSEHHQLYQYELFRAKNIFLTHIQTETPYYQAQPDALQPYKPGWRSDPQFEDCEPGSYCMEAWALRVIESSDILIYSAGMYSFFQSYEQTCLLEENCQEKLVETSYTEGLWLFNVFTKGATQVITPRGGIPPTLQSDDNQSGFTTEISAWLVLALTGADIGGTGGRDEGSGVVYIDQGIFLSPDPVVQCWNPCTLVFPPSPVPSGTVISFPVVSTSLVVGTSTITEISVDPVTTSTISFSNMPIPGGRESFTFSIESSIDPPPVTITVGIITTIITLPAISEPSNSETTTTPVYVLPTTVISSGSITQTFSEDQITKLSTQEEKTTTTTTLTHSSSGSSTTVALTVPVNTGGFWWSPIPVPGPTPFPIPIPGFPPIPDPPCFNLFGIFSFNCPPDHRIPTTTFSVGPPSPSCTASCGTLSDSDSSSSSTCSTETRTACHTICREDPCSTVCNTYVGCACPTETVTDYYVSCTSVSNTESCTTTSSSVITGCYVEGITSTTGEYCPRGITIGPDDDQGDYPAETKLTDVGTFTTTTRPQVVVIDGNTYTVTSSTIVVSGEEYTIPSVTTTSTVIIDGSSATIHPSTTTRTFVITNTDFFQPTSIPDPTDPEDPPDTAHKLVTFFLFQLYNGINWSRQWWALEERTDTLTDVCEISPVFTDDAVATPERPGYPPGPLGPFSAHGVDDCVYEGTKDAPGTLICGSSEFECIRDPQYGVLWDCGFGASMTVVVRCRVE